MLLGEEESVLFRAVSLFQGGASPCNTSNLDTIGPEESVLFREVPLFLVCPYRRVYGLHPQRMMSLCTYLRHVPLSADTSCGDSHWQ